MQEWRKPGSDKECSNSNHDKFVSQLNKFAVKKKKKKPDVC